MILTEKRVDPRVRRTRKLLQQACIELYQEKGASMSIQDITERATVNRATFYAHYPDKYALVASIFREQFQQALAQHLPKDAVWNVQSLRALVRTTFGFLGEFHHNCQPGEESQCDPLFEQAIQQELVEVLLTWLKQAKVAGMRPGVRLEVVASVVSWTIFGPAVEWSHNERTLSADEMANQTLLLITEGLIHLAPGFLPTERALV